VVASVKGKEKKKKKKGKLNRSSDRLGESRRREKKKGKGRVLQGKGGIWARLLPTNKRKRGKPRRASPYPSKRKGEGGKWNKKKR